MDQGPVATWKKRIDAAKKLYKKWEDDYRVKTCYNYWRGEQLAQPMDEFGNRRAQINKIHPEVRNNIPSLYYYRPFARIAASPEQIDDPGTTVEEDVQLLQDTANHLIRDPRTMFRDSTFLGLKEAHWALGVVEVGYSADFLDAPNADKPPLKEQKSTKIAKPLPAPPVPAVPVPLGVGAPPDAGMTVPEVGMATPPPPLGASSPDMGAGAPGGPSLGATPAPDLGPALTPAPPLGPPDELQGILAQLEQLKGSLKQEKFFVRHIPSNQMLVSISDMPILETNDWIGYWEDVPLEDVKKCEAYSNTGDLKANTGDEEGEKAEENYNDAVGGFDKIRLYKIWDLRSIEKIVLAEGHGKELMRKPYKRLPLKILRFDIDPYHFFPRPLVYSKLDPQDEYNDSREYLRKIRMGTVPRYTYDEDAVDAIHLGKLESGKMGTFVPRRSGTSNVFEPIQQPSYSENAIQTLTLSDKEFNDVGGVGGDARVAQSKTATQAKISETKNQVQDSFDRQVTAEWLASIVEELVFCAIDNMNLTQWVAINVVPETQYTQQLTQQLTQAHARINAEILSNATAGVRWSVVIDIESMSPVSEEEKKQEWMQALSLFANPPMARLFSVSPELLIHTLSLLGIKSSKDQQMILGAMQQVVQMEAQLAAQGQNAAPGMSGQPGGGPPPAKPGPGGPQPNAGPPKPPGPPPSGPGASPAKM